jgi:hypothetical protein
MPKEPIITLYCADCGKEIHVMEFWSGTPERDVERCKVPGHLPAATWPPRGIRRLICTGCYDSKNQVLFAGIGPWSHNDPKWQTDWVLVGDKDPDERYGSCKFCGDRGHLWHEYCCQGCASVEYDTESLINKRIAELRMEA